MRSAAAGATIVKMVGRRSILWLNYSRNAVPRRVVVMAFFNYAISSISNAKVLKLRYPALWEDSRVLIINQAVASYLMTISMVLPLGSLPGSQFGSLGTAFTSIPHQQNCQREALLKDLEWRDRAVWIVSDIHTAYDKHEIFVLASKCSPENYLLQCRKRYDYWNLFPGSMTFWFSKGWQCTWESLCLVLNLAFLVLHQVQKH